MAVYAIRAEGTDLYKIGWSKNPEARLVGLQTANPHNLALVAVIPDADHEMERLIHKTLRDRRCNGEWFRLDACPAASDLSAWAQAAKDARMAAHANQRGVNGGLPGWHLESGHRRTLMGRGIDPGDADIVDVDDIKKRTAVHRFLALEWTHADGFPEPRWRVGSNLWDWDLDIVPWLKATDRWGVLPLERPQLYGRQRMNGRARAPAVNPVGRRSVS